MQGNSSLHPHPSQHPRQHPYSRGNQLGVTGWAAVSDALDRVTTLTSLNGCDYNAIRAGGVVAMELGGTELCIWADRFLHRSADTLSKLDVRCAVITCRVHSGMTAILHFGFQPRREPFGL